MQREISTALALCSAIIVVAWSLCGTTTAEERKVLPQQLTKNCLFGWFGLTNEEKSMIRGMIHASDGSQASRSAIFDKYGTFCAGQEYQNMTSCLSFSVDLQDCLVFLDAP